MSAEPTLTEVADGVSAWVQPDGSWGLSNAGLISGDDASILVDTLFDLSLTRRMLDSMAHLTAGAPIGTVVNTHANGDHCYGNQLLAGPDTSFVASTAASEEIDEVTPGTMTALLASTSGQLGEYLQHAFGAFDFSAIDVPPITDTFDGRLALSAGGRTVELIEVGPAHTGGDILAWLPDERVLFAGDILFIGGTPIMWAGPVGNWIAACDLIERLDPAVVVPGHGPLTDRAGAAEVREYLTMVRDGTAARHRAGMGPRQASLDLDLEVNGTRFGQWTDRERLVVTVHSLWRELEHGYEPPDVTEIFTMMAEDWRRHEGRADPSDTTALADRGVSE